MRVIVAIIPDVLTADVSCQFERLFSFPALLVLFEEMDTDWAVGCMNWAALSLCSPNLFLVPIFVYNAPLIYLYKIIIVRVSFILLCDKRKDGLCSSSISSVGMHVRPCGSTELQSLNT